MELPWLARCQSKRIKNDSQPDFGVRMIKKGRKKTKSWQRLNNEKYKIYLKRFGLNTLVPEVFLDFSSRKRSTASREAATTSPLAMKKMPDAFSIYFACFQIPPFETMILNSFWAITSCKIGKHAQVKHFPNRSAKHARACSSSAEESSTHYYNIIKDLTSYSTKSDSLHSLRAFYCIRRPGIQSHFPIK